ncbi:hypothetical protein [Pseudorhodoferax sp.]|uniref:hypothetical protein n=1 Tax=Pseudorhodoferax sp. TaxID=1993553 RepID=UPI0039E69444
MRYILYNSESELAAFILQGGVGEGTELIGYPEMPATVLGRIGRGVESLLPRTRLALYPDPRVGRQLRRITPADTVLFFAIENTRNIANLAKYIATRDMHVFLWNPIARLKGDAAGSVRQLARIKRLVRSIHTFDGRDAARYGLRLVPQPYRKVAPPPTGTQARCDFYFSGVDKGRLAILLELKAAIGDLGMRPSFHIVGDRHRAYTPQEQAHLAQDWIAYADNVRRSQQAGCLVEIVQEHQSGPTLRSVEALFLRRKIVTNRPSAREDAFFDPHRVLVIGDRVDRDALRHFMAQPFDPPRPALLAPHDIRTWLDNLLAA